MVKTKFLIQLTMIIKKNITTNKYRDNMHPYLIDHNKHNNWTKYSFIHFNHYNAPLHNAFDTSLLKVKFPWGYEQLTLVKSLIEKFVNVPLKSNFFFIVINYLVHGFTWLSMMCMPFKILLWLSLIKKEVSHPFDVFKDTLPLDILLKTKK